MIEIYSLAWLVLPIIAILNGALRDLVYGQYLGDFLARQVSTLTLIILIGLYTWLLGLRWKIQTPSQAWVIGIIWMVLTLAFEFLFGHYVMGNPWGTLLLDYDIFSGQLWVLIPIWVAVAPYAIRKITVE